MMVTPCRRSSRPRPPRKAFTLIELLVVISIMALLTAMFVVVMARTTENARVAGTRTLIRLLDSALQDRIEGFRSANLRTVATRTFPSLSGSPELAEALYRNIVFRSTFPQRFQDLYGYDGQATPATDNAPLYSIVVSKLNQATADLERNVSSSELLYLILTEGESYGVPSLNLDGIDARYVADTDGDGLMEFVDGWGNQIRFYNFPTGLLRPDGNLPIGTGQPITVANYTLARVLWRSLPPLPVDMSNNPTALPGDPDNYSHPLNADPFDPLGEIELAFNTGGTTFPTPTLTAARFQQQFHPLNTFSTPLIVSAGPDEQLGLYEPNLYALSKGTNPSASSMPQTSNVLDRLAVVNTTFVDDIYDNLTNQQRGGL